jgi:hypothetical protein
MWQFGVPNAPCGVERATVKQAKIATPLVPNAPCGVERLKKLKNLKLIESS